MKAEIYVVPMGIMGQNIMTTIETYVPDLMLVISPGNSNVFDSKEEATERYENLQKVAEIEIDDDEKPSFEALKEVVQSKREEEEKILSQLEPILSETVQKLQNEPQIHIPTLGEASQILGQEGPSLSDDDDLFGGSNIIVEG